LGTSHPTAHPLHEAVINEAKEIYIPRNDIKSLLGLLDVDANDTGFDSMGGQYRWVAKSVPIPFPGITPLHLAVILGNDHAFRVLVHSDRVNVNVVSGKPYRLTALEIASLLNKKWMIVSLLKKRAKLPHKSVSNKEGVKPVTL
jgi:Ankyrin repeat